MAYYVARVGFKLGLLLCAGVIVLYHTQTAGVSSVKFPVKGTMQSSLSNSSTFVGTRRSVRTSGRCCYADKVGGFGLDRILCCLGPS